MRSSRSEIKDDAIKTKGYFIYPSQLFANVAKASANTNDSLNTDLAQISCKAIEGSASGYPSEQLTLKGLFA